MHVSAIFCFVSLEIDGMLIDLVQSCRHPAESAVSDTIAKCPGANSSKGIDPSLNECGGNMFDGWSMNFQMAKWVVDNGYAGVMVFCISYDAPPPNSLLAWTGAGLH